MRRRQIAAVLTAWLAIGLLTGCTTTSDDSVTFRLWDPQVAEAYRDSLDQFEATSGIHVDIVVVPWADYWTQLRADIGAGVVDDVFWTNATNFQEYADAGAIRPVSADLIDTAGAFWEPAVVTQYSYRNELWGVPQITDPGIALLYNADLLAAAGLDASDLDDLSWDPTAPDDTLRTVARTLTVDDAGRHPGDPQFSPARIQQYGFGAANDLNGVVLQFLGSNGAAWQAGDEFQFASPQGVEAIAYLADMINTTHVAPPAQDTNPPTGTDFVRDQFLGGRVALFPTGAYNLSNVAEAADFRWGIAPLPRGPEGAISVTNGVVLAADSRSDAPEAQQALLHWLGTAAGQQSIGASGSALPAARDAQPAFASYWASLGVDVSPMIDVLANGSVQAPQGARYADAADAMQAALNDVFLGRVAPNVGLRAAQDAANAALRE